MTLTHQVERMESKLPWWTWVAPLIIFHAGSQISVLFRYTQGVGTFYLPTALGVILINWWGWKRVLPAMYLNSALSTSLWGITQWYMWPVYSFPEVLATFISWWLFTHLAKGKYWLPDTAHTLRFIFLAILIPLVIDLLILQVLLIYNAEQPVDLFWDQFLRNLLGELTANFGICMAALYLLTRFMQRKGWLLRPPPYEVPAKRERNGWIKIEIYAIYLLLIIFSVLIPFDKYWFLYGIISLYVAIRFGFGETIVCNLFIFLITYIFPSFFSDVNEGTHQEDYLYTIFLGNLMLYIFAVLTGRVISDLRSVERKLNRKNLELETTNKELDRFVYSASHDLSSPLKSILGLVNISNLDKSTEGKSIYLKKIEESVVKLESFISEILDYSRNKRMDLIIESIELKALCIEILDNLKYADTFKTIVVNMNGLADEKVFSNKPRLKMILNNLLSNAIKFQRDEPDNHPMIEISAKKDANSLVILIEDNGEGIRPEYQSKIFDMFFRGTHSSKGSGLGLYIAKEAADKINATISVSSHYGKGTLFTIELSDMPLN